MPHHVLAVVGPSHLHLSWVDLIIVAVVGLAALGGWRHGCLGDAARSIGHLGGALVGFVFAMSWAVPRVSSPLPAWVLLMALTLAGAAAGGALGTHLVQGGRGRSGPVGAILAGVLAGLVALGASWAVVEVAGDLGSAQARTAAQRSSVVTALDRADPSASAVLAGALKTTHAPVLHPADHSGR